MIFERTGIQSVYTMHAMQSFAQSLLGIFVPIYLLTLGNSLSEVLIFFIIYYAVMGPGAFVAIWIAKKLGLIHTINLRFPLLIIFLVCLYLLKQYDFNIYWLAVIGGVQNILYWIPLHLLFTLNAKNKNIGSSTGILFALPKVVNLFAPFIGGLIAYYFGFGILIAISSIIYLLSTLPLVRAGNIAADFTFKFKNGLGLIKKYPKYFLAELFENLGEETSAIIWPLFIYWHYINIPLVGALGTIAKVGAILFTLILGKHADKSDTKKMFKWGAVLLSVIWILRYFVINDVIVYSSTMLIGFFMLMLLVPYSTVLYKVAKKETTDEFFVFREIPVAISRVAILSIALLFVSQLEVTFLVSGIAYLYFLFI